MVRSYRRILEGGGIGRAIARSRRALVDACRIDELATLTFRLE